VACCDEKYIVLHNRREKQDGESVTFDPCVELKPYGGFELIADEQPVEEVNPKFCGK
jgi:hypothetical protein